MDKGRDQIFHPGIFKPTILLIFLLCFVLTACTNMSQRLPQKRVSLFQKCFNTNEKAKRNLILFIHGLNGDPYSTWERFPCLIKKDRDLSKQYDIASYSYPSGLFLGGNLPKIQEVAAGLRTEINNKYSDYESISIISHSMGGLITRQYILEEIEDDQALKIKNLVLYAVPNNGSDLATYWDIFPGKNNQIDQLKKGSDFIEFLNKDWMRKRNKEKIDSKIKIKYVIAGGDRAVDKISATMFWGNANTETILGESHSSLVKPRSEEALSFIIAKRLFLKKAKTKIKTETKHGPLKVISKNLTKQALGVYIEKMEYSGQAKNLHLEKLRRAIESMVGSIEHVKILNAPNKANVKISTYLRMQGNVKKTAQHGMTSRNSAIVEELEVVAIQRLNRKKLYRRKIRSMTLEAALHLIENDLKFEEKLKNAITSKK